MTLYMIEGDIVAAADGDKASARVPRAIFCTNGVAAPATWVRLTEEEIRHRLADGYGLEIFAREYARELEAISEHEA